MEEEEDNDNGEMEEEEEVEEVQELMIGRKELNFIVRYFKTHGFPNGNYSTWNVGNELLKTKLLCKFNLDTVNTFINKFMKHILSEEIDENLSQAIDNKTLNSLLKIYYV